MRKLLITPGPERIPNRGGDWLNVERAAVVEVTSEDKNYPIESAFVSQEAQGWRAAGSGSQTIRLVFDQPQRLRRISLPTGAKRLPNRNSLESKRLAAIGWTWSV